MPAARWGARVRTTGYRGPRSPRPPAVPVLHPNHGRYAGLCAAVEGLFFAGDTLGMERDLALERLEREARALGLLCGSGAAVPGGRMR